MLHIGQQNYIQKRNIISILDLDSRPIADRVRLLDKKGVVTNACNDRRARSAIFMNDGTVILASTTTSPLNDRFEQGY